MPTVNDPFNTQDLYRIVMINPLSPVEADYLTKTVQDWRRDTGFAADSLPEPITYEAIKDWIRLDKGTYAERQRLASFLLDNIKKGTLPTYKPDFDKAFADATLPGGWVERLVRAFFSTLTSPDTWTALSNIDLARYVNIDLQDWQNIKSAALAFLADPNGPLQKYIAINATAIAKFVEILTGLTLSEATVRGILDGSITADDKRAMGHLVYSILTDNLLEPEIKAGYLKREPGVGEVANLERLFGGLMRLEVGGIALEAVEPFVPKAAVRFMKSVREAVENSLNLDDAAEEIFQVPIEELISKGLTASYNRKFKPADLSDNEARQALIAEQIDKATYNKVLDNSGVRDDIRDILLDFTAANLTESDLDQLYQHNLLSRDEVKDQYRQKYFQEPERELKTKLVEGTRRWKLEEKIFELYGNLYRDGVATRVEVTPFLEHYGYDADEVDMWFQVQELERRQRRWLSVNQVMKLVEKGMMQADYAIDYLVMQGMTGEDATVLFLSDLLDAHQKKLPEDCQKVLTEAFTLSKVLAAALGKIPEFGLSGLFGKSELQKIIECLLKASQP